MAISVTASAQCICSFGTAPSALMVLPEAMAMAQQKPMVNIMPFAMCTSMSNPQVSAATAAAAGVLTPMPCVPVTNAPWTPGSTTVMIKGKPALNNTCKLMCNWGGVISITNPGATTVMIP